MSRLRLAALALALLVVAPGCADDLGPVPSYDMAATAWDVRDASLGSSYDVEVAAKHAGPTSNRHVALFQFDAAAGQRFAVVVRRADDSELDAFLTLYGEAGDALATSKYDQALLPMAAESDAVIVHSATAAERFTVFAADLELAVDARFQVDLIALDSDGAIDATLTSPATRALVKALRSDEAQVASYLDMGAVSEDGEGMLDAQPQAVSELQQRAQLSRFVEQVNDVRMQLFEFLAEQGGSDHGALCAELWQALRSDDHALRTP